MIEPSRGTDPQAQGNLCTIIICTLAITERGRSLARAIASVRTHNAVVPSVLVVVNGDRYDPTLLATLKARGDIDVLQIPEKSLSAAIAAGRRAVRTPFFGFLDDDDEYLPGAIDVRLALLESNPHAGVAVTNGLRSINGVDEVIMQHINLVTADPLTAVFHEQWLASCSALYRAAVVPAEMFENIARYLEWTWLAFVMASAHTQVVTADVPTGLVVLHARLTLQLLAPAAIVHDGAVGVRVPDMGPRHVLPFHVVPDAQLAVAVLVTSSCALL